MKLTNRKEVLKRRQGGHEFILGRSNPQPPEQRFLGGFHRPGSLKK